MVPPNTAPMAWCPRHTPSSGIRPPSSRITCIVMPASSGRPGPGEIEMAECAGVQPAPRRLELLDDFHRPHFRRTGYRAGGKARHERVEAIAIVGEPAFDDRGEVLHVRKPLDAHQLRHPHRSV